MVIFHRKSNFPVKLRLHSQWILIKFNWIFFEDKQKRNVQRRKWEKINENFGFHFSLHKLEPFIWTAVVFFSMIRWSKCMLQSMCISTVQMDYRHLKWQKREWEKEIDGRDEMNGNTSEWLYISHPIETISSVRCARKEWNDRFRYILYLYVVSDGSSIIFGKNSKAANKLPFFARKIWDAIKFGITITQRT